MYFIIPKIRIARILLITDGPNHDDYLILALTIKLKMSLHPCHHSVLVQSCNFEGKIKDAPKIKAKSS